MRFELSCARGHLLGHLVSQWCHPSWFGKTRQHHEVPMGLNLIPPQRKFELQEFLNFSFILFVVREHPLSQVVGALGFFNGQKQSLAVAGSVDVFKTVSEGIAFTTAWN